jgi:prolyl 4-hydroxylase
VTTDLQTAIAAAYQQRWHEALDLALRAAEAGDPLARGQLAVLAEQPPASAPRLLRDAIDVDAITAPPPLTRISSLANLNEAQGFVTHAMCKWFITRAQFRLQPARVNDAATGELRQHPMRTALDCAFGPDQRDLVVAAVQTRAARATNVALNQHEAPNVISYLPGQQFALHVDYIDPGTPGFEQELAIAGQRIVTIVTYLNDDFEGAPTHFPALKVDVRGKAGDALVWWNVLPSGEPDHNTVHAGLPPTSGRKWVLSQWLRDRPQSYT